MQGVNPFLSVLSEHIPAIEVIGGLYVFEYQFLNNRNIACSVGREITVT